MNAFNQTEIIAPKNSIFASEVAGYPNSKLLDKARIATIFHKKNIHMDCIVFSKNTRKKQNTLGGEVMGVIFVADDKFKDFLSEFASLVAIKELKNKTLLLDTSTESKAVLRRIINAYKIQSPSEIIAKFAVYKEDDEILLQIKAADFTELTINAKEINALANMSYKELSNFELEEYGFDISWPAQDIHLSLESFKMISDKKFMKKRIKEIGEEKKVFGSLMKKYRETQSQFTQKDFGTLSERQVRKYENGENYPSYDSLQAISSAYGMTVNEYLNALSECRSK